jgi:hypothetical protein
MYEPFFQLPPRKKTVTVEHVLGRKLGTQFFYERRLAHALCTAYEQCPVAAYDYIFEGVASHAECQLVAMECFILHINHLIDNLLVVTIKLVDTTKYKIIESLAMLQIFFRGDTFFL